MVEGDSVLDTVELTLDPGLLTTSPTEGMLSTDCRFER